MGKAGRGGPNGENSERGVRSHRVVGGPLKVIGKLGAPWWESGQLYIAQSLLPDLRQTKSPQA